MRSDSCGAGSLSRAITRPVATRSASLFAISRFVETLAKLQVDFEASFHLAFFAAQLLGKQERGTATSQERKILRLLTPLAKLFTAKKAVAAVSEIIECFGGAGYVEDTGLPTLLRDSQVLTIWEGTTNVLSLDLLRALRGEDALEALLNDLLDARRVPTALTPAQQSVRVAIDQLRRHFELLAGRSDLH